MIVIDEKTDPRLKLLFEHVSIIERKYGQGSELHVALVMFNMAKDAFVVNEHPDTALLRAYGKMLPEDVRHERSGCVVCPHCEYREPEAAAIEARALELAAEVQQP